MKYYGMDLILRHHPQHAMRCKYICAGVFITHKLWGPRIRTCFSLRILQVPLLYADCVWCVCVCANIFLTSIFGNTRTTHSTCCQHEIPSFCSIFIAETFYLCGLHFGRHFARTRKRKFTHKV